MAFCGIYFWCRRQFDAFKYQTKNKKCIINVTTIRHERIHYSHTATTNITRMFDFYEFWGAIKQTKKPKKMYSKKSGLMYESGVFLNELVYMIKWMNVWLGRCIEWLGKHYIQAIHIPWVWMNECSSHSHHCCCPNVQRQPSAPNIFFFFLLLNAICHPDTEKCKKKEREKKNGGFS